MENFPKNKEGLRRIIIYLFLLLLLHFCNSGTLRHLETIMTCNVILAKCFIMKELMGHQTDKIRIQYGPFVTKAAAINRILD